MEKEDLNILRLMREIDRDGNSSQRELSRRLNISLGLVNTFLKRLVKKGYFKVKTMPRNRVKYFLTPAGLARKSRLTLEFLQYSLHFYGDIKSLILNIYDVQPLQFISSCRECDLGVQRLIQIGKSLGFTEPQCPRIKGNCQQRQDSPWCQ